MSFAIGTYRTIHSFLRGGFLTGAVLLSVFSSYAQTLTLKQLGPCKEDKIWLGASTDGRFLGWKQSDGTSAGIITKDSLNTLVSVEGKTTFVATAEFRTPNLIKNGDFEQGQTAIPTDYTYVPKIDQPGEFSLVKNPNEGRSTAVYTTIGDHTSGNGSMLVADGDTGTKRVLKYKIPVNKGVEYYFSVWIANIHKKLVSPSADTADNKMPRLQFSINKVVIGVYNFPFDSLWHPFTATWKATKNDSILLEVVDLQKKLKANDFALDDVDFYHFFTKQERITVDACSKTDVFSPDGDGVLDTYYIEEFGMAKIFDLDGNLVHEIPTPAHWDGTKRNGLLADAGYYAVVINDAKSYRVSLMR